MRHHIRAITSFKDEGSASHFEISVLAADRQISVRRLFGSSILTGTALMGAKQSREGAILTVGLCPAQSLSGAISNSWVWPEAERRRSAV
jgi:hypothetical protein